MARSIYITSAEGNTGKSTIALGVLDTLLHSIERVGVFRPIARSTHEPDYVLELLLAHLHAGAAAGPTPGNRGKPITAGDESNAVAQAFLEIGRNLAASLSPA